MGKEGGPGRTRGKRNHIRIYRMLKKNLFSKKKGGKKKLKSVYIVELSKLINTQTFMNLTTLGEKKIKIYSKDFHE